MQHLNGGKGGNSHLSLSLDCWLTRQVPSQHLSIKCSRNAFNLLPPTAEELIEWQRVITSSSASLNGLNRSELIHLLLPRPPNPQLNWSDPQRNALHGIGIIIIIAAVPACWPTTDCVEIKTVAGDIIYTNRIAIHLFRLCCPKTTTSNTTGHPPSHPHCWVKFPFRCHLLLIGQKWALGSLIFHWPNNLMVIQPDVDGLLLCT